MHPELAFDLARVAGAGIPARHHRFEHGATEFDDPGRRGVAVQTDVVVLAISSECPDSGPVAGLSIEVQRSRDQNKGRTMPITRAGVRSRHACPAWVLFVAVEPALRRWAREDLFPLEPELVPLIVEPEMLPAITEVELARERIAHATAAAVFHSRDPVGVACARATIEAAHALDARDRDVYVSLVLACQDDERMKQVLSQLPPEIEEELTPFERSSAYFVRGKREGLAEGVEQGVERELGRMRSALMTLLDERAVHIDGPQRARIEACRDPEQLLRWAARAAVIERAEQLFGASN